MSRSASSAVSPQRVDAPLTKSATFLVVTLTNDVSDTTTTVRSTLASIADLSKNVAIRDPSAAFTCTVGIGSSAWDTLLSPLGHQKPAELHAFRAVKGALHTAPSTPGDLLFHIRSERRDLNFEFERQLLDSLGNSVAVADETVGFRYFDVRDLLGFVDGTANPSSTAEVTDAVLVTSQDEPSQSQASAAVGGSYVVVQKYVHNMKTWRALPAEAQEAIIGRTKWDNAELDDPDDPQTQKAHKTLATISDDDGNEYAILRDNMPFGSPGAGEFGTYFIGYARRLWVVERMLERMFVGDPPGLHDRLLDYSTALTGSVFFAPNAGLLASLGD
ncbi:hypothetical protein B0H63DRAFT_491043 [Podospora didyma]|uniref:Peroxidase n=1 Tax=Podospora didyma TaxID=330526 RepID=A0AAE0P479_9PEZI|nr:hypothetical protein B0H63DRAFT_491043 [Podospora didyma]